MERFKGIYFGFSPTDESVVSLGEMEVIIDKDKVKTRMATGLEINNDEYLVKDFTLMSPDEAMEYTKGAESIPDGMVDINVFKHQSNYPRLIFVKDKKANILALRIDTGGMGAGLAPTILVDSEQLHEDMISKLEGDRVGVFPRLSNNGKAHR